MTCASKAPLELLLNALQLRLPELDVQWDIPKDSSGVHYTDVVSPDKHFVLQWQEGHGFGVAEASDGVYGEGPNFVSSNEEIVLEFLVEKLAPRPFFSVHEDQETLVDCAKVACKDSAPALSLVVLRSGDLDRAARFYTAIGLRLVRHSHGNGPEHLSSEGPGPIFEIYPESPSAANSQGVRIGFEVSSVDSTLNAALRAGGTLKSPSKASPWGRRAVVTDPDGHVVEFTTPL